MSNPVLIEDKFSRLWRLDTWEQMYYCLSNLNLHAQSFDELVEKVSPLYPITRGEEIVKPFKPIAKGTWVELERNILVPMVSGMVHDYDPDKMFYRVLINVPRDSVKETP